MATRIAAMEARMNPCLYADHLALLLQTWAQILWMARLTIFELSPGLVVVVGAYLWRMEEEP